MSPGARSGQSERRLVLRIGTGAPFRTTQPTVFSYCDNPKDKRAFMPVASTAAPDELQVFDIPTDEAAPGYRLGFGANAIVQVLLPLP